MPDYVINNNIAGTSQLLRSSRYQEGKTIGKERMNWKKKHALRQQADSWGDKVALCLVVRSVLWRVQLVDNRRTTEETRRTTSQDEGRHQGGKKKRVNRNEVMGFRWICICLVFRGDPVRYRMIYRDICWYHIPYHVIPRDAIHRDIVSISPIVGTDIEI